MANEQDHIECANRTQKTIQHLLTDPAAHSPWIATIAFYKALHVVEAVFANSGVHTSNHGERELKLKSERKYQKLAEHYLPLQRAGWNARYLAEQGAFDSYLSPEEVIEKLLKHELHQLEKSAKKFLKKPDALLSVNSAFASEPSP